MTPGALCARRGDRRRRAGAQVLQTDRFPRVFVGDRGLPVGWGAVQMALEGESLKPVLSLPKPDLARPLRTPHRPRVDRVMFLVAEGNSPNTPPGRCKAFLALARSCLEDARKLDNLSKVSNGGYILIAHALELSLKAFLAKHKLSEKELTNRDSACFRCSDWRSPDWRSNVSIRSGKRKCACLLSIRRRLQQM